MSKYQYRFSVMRFATVEAKDITDAAIQARKFLAGLPDSFAFDMRLDVTAVDWPGREPRFDPPLDPVDEKKASAA